MAFALPLHCKQVITVKATQERNAITMMYQLKPRQFSTPVVRVMRASARHAHVVWPTRLNTPVCCTPAPQARGRATMGTATPKRKSLLSLIASSIEVNVCLCFNFPTLLARQPFVCGDVEQSVSRQNDHAFRPVSRCLRSLPVEVPWYARTHNLSC